MRQRDFLTVLPLPKFFAPDRFNQGSKNLGRKDKHLSPPLEDSTVLVHRYEEVDLERVAHALKEGLSYIDQFLADLISFLKI